MRSKALTEIHDDRITLFVLNGGGQRPYNRFHRVIKLFSQYNLNIIAVELPGHGESSFAKQMSASELLDDFYIDFKKLSQRYSNVALFGFSLGGLLSLKALEQHLVDYEFGISVGAAIEISKDEEKIMKKYTTKEFFENMRWMDNMLYYHKNGWEELLVSMHDILHVNSPIFVKDPSTIDVPVHLILGDKDEVANPHLQKPISDKNENIKLHVLENTSHFNYFVKSWPKTENLLNDILTNYLL